VHFVNAKLGVDLPRPVTAAATATDGPVPVDWESSSPLEVTLEDMESAPSDDAMFEQLPSPAGEAKRYAAFSRDFASWLYRSQTMELFSVPELKMVSSPGEEERDFRIRLQQAARETRDQWADQLRTKYATKITTLEERLRKAQQAVEREADQARDQKMQTAVSFGSTLLGAFLGRKKLSASTLGRATTAARGVSRSARAGQDVDRAKETVASVQQQLADLEVEFQTETDALSGKAGAMAEQLTTLSIKPKKADIQVRLVALAWAPYWRDERGANTQAW
jgi:hypothetical protein